MRTKILQPPDLTGTDICPVFIRIFIRPCLFKVLANWMRDFDVVLLEDERGGYGAIVPALPGCHTQGDTLAQVMENIKEA